MKERKSDAPATQPGVEQKNVVTRIELKATTDSNDNGGFEGYAAYFGNVDSYGDVIQPGAFSKTIQERKGKVKVLWNHDMFGLPIGKPTDMYEDEKGLYVKADFAGTQQAQDIRTLMSEGIVDSMSIGFSTIKSVWEEKDGEYIRNLMELKLYEFSLVNIPANPLASVTGTKAAVDVVERTLEQLDRFVAAGIKSGRPLSAENLKRLRDAYDHLGGLLADAPETEEAKGGNDLVEVLKGLRITESKTQKVEDEIASALASIKFA